MNLKSIPKIAAELGITEEEAIERRNEAVRGTHARPMSLGEIAEFEGISSDSAYRLVSKALKAFYASSLELYPSNVAAELLAALVFRDPPTASRTAPAWVLEILRRDLTEDQLETYRALFSPDDSTPSVRLQPHALVSPWVHGDSKDDRK